MIVNSGNNGQQPPDTELPVIVNSGNNGQQPPDTELPTQQPPSVEPPQDNTGSQQPPSNGDIQPPDSSNPPNIDEPPNQQPPEPPNNERQRDERGRFIGEGQEKGFFGRLALAIKGANTANIDPAIDAMREVGEMLSPLTGLFKRKRAPKPSREEENHNRRQITLLTRIKNLLTGNGGNGGGDGGGLGSGLAGGLLGGLLRGAGGLLLRAVMSPVTLLAGAFFGGYKLGEIIAPKISEWTDSLIKADIPKRISNAWDTFTGGLSDYFKEKINNIKENTKEVVNDARDTVGSVGDFAAYQTDKMLAKLGNKEAIERLAQRDRGEIGFTPTNYQAQTTNNTSLGQVAADTGEALSTQPNNKKQSDIVKILVNNSDGSNTVQLADGSIVRRTGARNWRNNNSGNIEYGDLAKKHGALGSDGRFAIFPSYEAGRAAKEELIFESNRGRKLSTKGDYGAGLGYKDKTLMQTIAAYAPIEDGNNTKLYQQTVLAAVGGVNKRMADYTPDERARVMDAMEKMEGYKKGKEKVLQAATQQPSQAQKPTIATINKTNAPIVNGLTTTPLAMLPKAQAPAFSLMRPTQKITTNPTAISQTQHKIAAPQIPKPESVKEPIGTPSPMMVRNVDNGQQITQNLSDRHLAHLVTGGLGMTDRWTR